MEYDVTLIFPPIPELDKPSAEFHYKVDVETMEAAAEWIFAYHQDRQCRPNVRASAMCGDVIKVTGDDKTQHFIVWGTGMREVTESEAIGWMQKSFKDRSLQSLGIDMTRGII